MYDGHTNVRSEPFDFRKWKEYLRSCGDSLRSKGYKVTFGFTDEISKPKTVLQAKNDLVGGYFSNWITGETDFEVMDLHSGTRTVNKMGLILNDSTFETTLDEFLSALGTSR